MGINPSTLAIGKEGGYIKPDYAYIQQQEYNFEEICEHARSSFRSGDTGVWDGIFWCIEAQKKFTSSTKAAKAIAKEVNISVRWILRGIQVWKKFSETKDNYPNLYFQHFIAVVSLQNEKEIKKWLDKAHDENWSSKRLYLEMTKKGEYPKDRWTPIDIFEGKLADAEDGFRVYANDKEFILIEDELDKIKGSTIQIILKVKQEGKPTPAQPAKPTEKPTKPTEKPTEKKPDKKDKGKDKNKGKGESTKGSTKKESKK